MKNKDAEKNNPCLKEQEQTYKCFHDNNFDKDACQMHMQNYKTCKEFWSSVKAERRRQGLYPLLPPVEERDSIKNEFFSRFK